MKRSVWPILLLALVSCDFGNCAATVEQMEKSMIMVRGVCLPKLKISEESANGIRDGIMPDEKPVKCYIHCCLELLGMMKKNKLNFDATMKQIDMMMPEDMREPYKSALTICKDSAVGIKDACDAGYTILKCIKNTYPEMLFP